MATLENGKLSGISSISTSASSLTIGETDSLLKCNGHDFIIPDTSTADSYNVVKPYSRSGASGVTINRGAAGDDSIMIVNERYSLASGDDGRSFYITINKFDGVDMNYCRVQPISIVCESEGASDGTYHNRIKYVGVTNVTSGAITCQFKAWFSEATTVDVTFLAIVTKQKAYEHNNTYYIKSYTQSGTHASSYQYNLYLNVSPSSTIYLAYRYADTFDELKENEFEFEEIYPGSKSASLFFYDAVWFQYYITSPDKMTTYSKGVRTLVLTSSSAMRTPDCFPVVEVTSPTNKQGSFTVAVTNPGPKEATLYMEFEGVESDGSPFSGNVSDKTLSSGDTYAYTGDNRLTSDTYFAVNLYSQLNGEDNYYDFKIGDIVVPS